MTSPQPRIGVLRFPGACDDRDALWALAALDAAAVFVWHTETELPDLDAVVLPGGFSYGDYLRCGAIARFAPAMEAVGAFAAGGGLVLGICNGFQILCEAGLLPGALMRNAGLKYICKQVHLRTETTDTPFTHTLKKGEVLMIPIGHMEGNYFCDAETLQQLQKQERIVFRYSTPQGEITPAANPNGSLDNVAGICNEGRNVLGMMPHPDRSSEGLLGSADGLKLFQAMVASSALAK